MDNEVELVSDGDGLAIIGSPTAVERFMDSLNLPAADSVNLPAVLTAGSAIAQTAAGVADKSGRWVKLTAKSAKDIQQYGLTPTKTPGISYAMAGKSGSIDKWLQIQHGIGPMLTSPVLLANSAALMSQFAMQQKMNEITDYLAIIDAKLDQVIRSQTNQVLARLDGVDLAIREAMRVRESVGRVSEVTWSKVQSSAQSIHETEGYALRQLNDLVEQVDASGTIATLADSTKKVEAEVEKWLLVLARCFELHDAVGVLELDRVLDASPDELDRHRLGLHSARQDRRELFAERLDPLFVQMSEAVRVANAKVLLNPIQSPSVISSSNVIAEQVISFLDLLEIESSSASAEARQWKEAASEHWDKARVVGSQGITQAKKLGGDAREGAAALKGKLSGRIPGRKRSTQDDE
ncbi:MAG: hypothetical protein F2520_03900 [Actinobacteria bacterium]|uniref:Unannotated protein n=1 Tax=freshwater metagenome TaxID=449393 RepID=A0A6J5YHH7_9ZZZZ|nr:hypothetical protein [Actinomycetota bacterium]